MLAETELELGTTSPTACFNTILSFALTGKFQVVVVIVMPQ